MPGDMYGVMPPESMFPGNIFCQRSNHFLAEQIQILSIFLRRRKKNLFTSCTHFQLLFMMKIRFKLSANRTAGTNTVCPLMEDRTTWFGAIKCVDLSSLHPSSREKQPKVKCRSKTYTHDSLHPTPQLNTNEQKHIHHPTNRHRPEIKKKLRREE